MTADPVKSIPAFYAGQNIFLTGATGFLGKVFIEKVLRSCPDVREIFLLMRPKKGLNVNQRLQHMLELPIFEKLRDEQASDFKKLIPISGEVTEKDLGLSPTDRQMLIERVTIVIHGAASVKFNDTLQYAIFVNTRATRDICILAQSMKNLKALVYVSTAFSNVNHSFIEEKVYPPTADWRKIIEIVESLDEHTLNIFTAKCIDCIPNTYIFSKNLAESIIQDYSSTLPCAIVRPSIIMPSVKEPVPGWIDNIYGPIGLFIGGGKGILRVAWIDKSMKEEVVPIDIVIKAVVVTAWKLGTTFTAGSTFVLNCTNQKHRIYQDTIKLLFDVTAEVPLEGLVWTPHTILTNNFVLFYILMIILHILPAIIIDLALYCSGRRPMLIQMQRKIYVVSCAMNYFSSHEWNFSNKNRHALMSLIPPENLDMFSLDYSFLNVKEYLKTCIYGGKRFLLHEDLSRLDKVRAHNRRVYLFVGIVKTIVSIGVLWMIYKWIYSYTL